MEKVTSHISKKEISLDESVSAEDIRNGILQLIKKDFPDFNRSSYLSISEFNKYRRLYISSMLSEEIEKLEDMEREVITAIQGNTILSENIEDSIEENITIGQHIADGVAKFGGSWTFIILFLIILIVWMIINVWVLAAKPFDPFPFILLNLLLSCLAAIQAPVILMSQNRQEQKDRKRSENDYKTNLKAELEIKILNEKVDHLISHQNKKLLQIIKELKNMHKS